MLTEHITKLFVSIFIFKSVKFWMLPHKDHNTKGSQSSIKWK